jgi:glycosyltransferase involved in cell wall biosynthesis
MDRRIEHDPSPAVAKAGVQLVVLIDGKARLPAAERTEALDRKATERNAVDLATHGAVVRRTPEPSVADTEARGERTSERPAPAAVRAHLAPAADIDGVRFLRESAQAGGEIAGRHLRMRVEAQKHVATRSVEPAVQRSRGDPVRICEHERACRAGKFRRSVARASVDHEHLERSRLLRDDRADAALDRGRLVQRRDDDGHSGREDVGRMRLGVFTGDRYWQHSGVVSSDVAFVRFLAGLAEQLSELVVFGRLAPSPGSAANVLSAPGLRFAPLPHYERLTDLRSVLRVRGESERVFAAGIEGLDAVWIFGPHPLAHRLVQIAERRSVRVFLGARMDFPRYVRHRSRGRSRLWALPAGIALDYAFRRLTRTRPTVVVGDELARHYGGRETLVSGFSLVRLADVVAEPPSRAWGETVKLLTVTRLEEEKNPLLLPEILAKLRADGDWRIEVVGDGPLRGALEEKARKLGVADAIELSGYVPFGNDLRERYRCADAFLHVSLTEGLPQVLFEAGAAGLPIVATDVGGVAEALARGERGIIVPPGDADAAAGALVALRNEGLRVQLASAALAYARAHTLEQQAGEILRFFTSSMKPASSAHGIEAAVRRRKAP